MEEQSNVIDLAAREYLNGQRNASASVAQSFEDDPEKAAKSIQIGEQSGQDPSVVFGNFDNVNREYRTTLTDSLIRNNHFLRDFINDNPIAAKVSHDDIGALDSVSEKLAKLGSRSLGLAPFYLGLKTLDKQGGIAEKAIESFKEGFGEKPFGSWISQEEQERIAQMKPFGPASLIAWQVMGLPIEVPARVIGGGLHALKTTVYESAIASGMSQGEANRLARDTAGIAEYQLMQTPGKGMGVPKIGEALGNVKMADRFNQALDAAKIAEPYLIAGKEPPIGLHPLIDEMKKRQSELDLANLDEATKEAQKSATRERAPQLFENYIKQHNDLTIGISADAVAELYGNKMPHAEDNLLGWAPNIEKQMYTALATGGDIEIPLSSWLARVDPETAKLLHDHIRVRRGGITKFEGEALKGREALMVEAYHGSPYEFEAFSMEKIGTGEGAQSYGHGLYFAENPKVAETYAGQLAARNIVGIPREAEAKYGAQYAKANAEEHALALQKVKATDPVEISRLDKLMWDKRNELTRILHDANEEFAPKGTRYRVRIHADKEHFLDWDKPLAEQTPAIQEALTKMGYFGEGRAVSEGYRKLASDFGGPEMASSKLKEAGIPGIKYLDQGSRFGKTLPELEQALAKAEDTKAQFLADRWADNQAKRNFLKTYEDEIADLKQQIANYKEPTSNFVLFDDSLIEITHKNDQAIEATRKAAGLDYSRLPLRQEGYPFTPAKERVTIQYGGESIELQPVGHDTLRNALGVQDISKLETPLPMQAIRERIIEVAGDVPVYLVTNSQFRAITQTPQGKPFPGAFYHYGGDVGDHIVVPASSFFHPEMLPRILMHEAIHAATSRALESFPEFQRIISPIMEEVGTKFPEMRKRYGFTDTHEFLAEALSNKDFQTDLGNIDLSPELAKALHLEEWRGKSLWQAIVEHIRRILGIPEENYSALEGALRVTELAAEVTEKMGPQKPLKGQARGAEPIQPELPGVTRQEDLHIFSTIAGWMNKEQYARYQELIAKRNAEDADFSFKKAERIERKRQTQEWKVEEAKVRDEVEGEFQARPDIAAVEFLRSGKLYGEDTGTRPRINEKTLTPEQRALLPEKYQRRDGMDPSDAAQLFGYPTFDEFAARVRQLDDAIGKGSLRDQVAKMSAQEVERRMQERFGSLEENILREAQEHVISDTQMDLLHEETVALGMKTGSEMTFTKADFRKWAEERFGDAQASSVSMEKYLKEVGKAGREVELALLKNDPSEAFRQKQRQYIAMLLGEQAKKFEKEVERFEKATKRMSQRVVKGMDQGFVDWTQRLLAEADRVGKRSPAELREATERSGFSSLREFTDFHRADGWELFVDEGILEGKIKPVDEMTVQEFRELKESVDSLMHVGRNVKKILVAGEAMDFDAFKQTVVDNISSLPPRDKNKPVKWIYQLDAELTKMEEILKDLDLRQELGPLFNSIIRPMADAKHTEFGMLEKLTKDLKEIKTDLGRKWQKTLKDDIHQDFLTDPYDGTLYDTSREHMINIMLNFGNRSNIEKFTRGYAGKDAASRLEARLWQWFDQYANKEDWQYVQHVWDIWESWRKDADSLYYDLSGVPPKWIEPQPITSKHGDFAGGYFPVIYDRLRSNLNLIEERKPSASDKGLFRRDYFRATPAASYAKERTGYIDVVEFQNPLDQAATRMQQTIHDISFRRAVMEAGKVIYDRDVRSAIRKHYGAEYEKQLSPWLEQTANYYNLDERGLQGINSWLRRARVALITHALGFNLKVIFSPATGTTNPMDIIRYERGFRENREMIMGKSRELEHTFRNIDRDYREQLEATIKGKRLDVWQAKAMQFAFYPTVKVDQFFREATFFNEYNKAIRDGRVEGEAVSLADSAVRERHGSGAVVDLPRIMRSNEAMKLATIFYGYFNTTYNWQRQIPGALRRGEYVEAAQTAWGAIVVPALFGMALFNERKESDSVFKTWAKAIPLQLMSTIPLARDLANTIIEGHASRTPWGSFVDAANSGINDIRKKMQGKKVEKPIKHAANAIGLGVGLPLGQAGRTSQFAFDVQSGRQRPRNIIEWMRGIIQGEARLKK